MKCPKCDADVLVVHTRILDRDPARPDEVRKIEGCSRCFAEQVGAEDVSAGRRNVVLAVGENGTRITQAKMDHLIETGSKAERWPKPGGGYDLEPVTLKSVRRRHFAMGLHR